MMWYQLNSDIINEGIKSDITVKNLNQEGRMYKGEKKLKNRYRSQKDK